MTIPENDNSPFVPTESDADEDFDFEFPDWPEPEGDPADEWLNLPGDCVTDGIRLDALEAAVAADPFSTSRLDDCFLAFGIGPTPFDRYQIANRRYLRSARNDDDTPETTELFRLIALYWLGRSRSILVD